MATTASAIDLPPEEAIAFLREKVNATSEDFTTVWQKANVKAFTVAGAATDALVDDFRQSVAKALETGSSLSTFMDEFDGIVARHGWVHNGNPAWRARTIYETNLSVAYSAGRYAQQIEPETLAAFPYWQYVHSGSAHPRHDHLSWDGLVLRADDAWWSTHYPPNGWGCGCWVRPVSARDLARQGKSGPDTAPKREYRTWINRKTGKEHQVPKGIDPGWDYNPGAEWVGAATVPDYATTQPRTPIAMPQPVRKAPQSRPEAAPEADRGPVQIEPAGMPSGTPIPPQPATPEAVQRLAEDALGGRLQDLYAETVIARLDAKLARLIETDAREVRLTPWRIRKVAGLAEEHGGLPSNAHPEVTPELWSRLGDLIGRGRVWHAPVDEGRHRFRQVLIQGDVDGRPMMAVVRVATGADGQQKLIVPTYHEAGTRHLARATRGMTMVRDGR
ncbi:phage minor head protein [Kaistia dalseonensis]|uniref:Phage head morphogenesis domain-containing protein n=1 Tax=Kaistia dalseonensis TaxID=410840 RepID=A0ABU0HCB1_9HYPH|nr:phage minor head protein [Kaistia dalseonensis]MCX5497317.1 phage minor head protein [Kaistia dalseonensis]MDQ0439954.1 hypothetical protein [Kaistia dalseonensis]